MLMFLLRFTFQVRFANYFMCSHLQLGNIISISDKLRKIFDICLNMIINPIYKHMLIALRCEVHWWYGIYLNNWYNGINELISVVKFDAFDHWASNAFIFCVAVITRSLMVYLWSLYFILWSSLYVINKITKSPNFSF